MLSISFYANLMKYKLDPRARDKARFVYIHVVKASRWQGLATCQRREARRETPRTRPVLCHLISFVVYIMPAMDIPVPVPIPHTSRLSHPASFLIERAGGCSLYSYSLGRGARARRMATRPGPLSRWPWHDLGNYKVTNTRRHLLTLFCCRSHVCKSSKLIECHHA